MSMSRRGFLASSAAVAVTAAMSASSYSRILGANDRINLGFMGTRSRGAALLKSFISVGGVNIGHICDVDTRVISQSIQTVTKAGFSEPKTTDDVRILLEDQSIDALVIAAPDHWHATAGVMALEAGKHVYVEKPLSHNPHEGEIFVEAQKKFNRVVQMGNQQRSSLESQEAIDLIHGGIIGRCYRAETWYGNNRGSIGTGKKASIPSWLNWKMWQGPAPHQEFKDNYVHYKWHWFWHWGTGELCNNAAHELDIARWALQVDFPEEVSVNGARNFYSDDDWEMYDTMQARFEFKNNKSIEWVGNSCNKINRFGRGRGTLILGTSGHAIIDRSGYEIYDLKGKLIKQRNVNDRAVKTTDLAGGGKLTDLHADNFLQTITGSAKKQSSPIELGHTSTMLCHLANIAYRTNETIICDSDLGKVKGKNANRFWGREFQSGWDLKL